MYDMYDLIYELLFICGEQEKKKIDALIHHILLNHLQYLHYFKLTYCVIRLL